MSVRRRDASVRLGVGLGVALAWSLTASAQPAPPKGNHYQCYPAEQVQPVKGMKVVLEDQFGKRPVEVGAITRLCNPVAKQVGDHSFPIENKDMHLVCVRIAGGQPGKRVKVSNQFGVFTLKVGPAQELCLPSSKILLEPTPGK